MIARALLGGGDLAGSRAIGVSLKIAWELEPSPGSGGQGPAAATGRGPVVFPNVRRGVGRGEALVIRAGAAWAHLGNAACVLVACGRDKGGGVGAAADV